MSDTTEQTFDGSIEQAVSLIVQPDEPVEETVEAQAEEVEQENNSESEDVSPEMEASESDDDDDAEVDDGEEDEVEVEASEDDDEAEDEPAPTEPTMFDVKVNGVETKVTLEELKRGYSGQQYIQQGMQEVAATRKQAEEAFMQYSQQANLFAAEIERVRSGQAILVEPTLPPIELQRENPLAYMEEKAKYDHNMVQYKRDLEQQNLLQAQALQHQEQAKKYKLQMETQKLVQMLPEMADPQKSPKIREKMIDVAFNRYGFTEKELSDLTDSKHFLVLHDAMRYREIMSGKSKAQAKAKGAKPVIKPGARKNQSSREAKQLERQRSKFKSSGRIEDLVGLIVNE